jgi:lipoprotein-releasing system ATP-binding protein
MLALHDVTFRYRRNADVTIGGLSHEFPAGTVTAVTGPSGYGKSTLLYLLGLMLTPTDGTVSWKSQVVSSLDDGERSLFRAKTIGFVFQDVALDSSRTVLDNVIEGGLYAGMDQADAVRMAHQLLQRFSVELRTDHLPGEISGGQAQRVGLCRALLKAPAIVLADEPTGNLDEDSAEVVWAALAAAAHEAGAVVVVGTHDRGLARRADLELDLTSHR